jgi:multidrug resistance efflux pump
MKIKFDLPPAAANQSNGLAVRYATAKRSVPRWRWNLLLGVVLLAPAYFLVRFAVASWWTTSPAIVVIEPVTVKAGAAGRVESVAEAGLRVDKGAALATLRPAAASDAGHEPAPAPVKAPAQPRVHEARSAASRASLSVAERQLQLSRSRLSTMQALFDDAAATAGELANARAQVLQAEAGLAQAQAEWNALRAEAAVPAPVAVAPARPAPPPSASAPLAPVAGAVSRTFVHVGDSVTPGTDLLQLVPDRPPVVRAYVEASQSRYAELGRRATLRFLDGLRVDATVVAIEPEAARLPSDRVAPLVPATPSILVELKPDQPLPERYRINQLPLDVRFEHAW